MRNPKQAAELKPKFMRFQSSYETVFTDTMPIETWPILVELFKSVDSILLKHSASEHRGERYLRNVRPLVSLLVVARRLGSFSYGVSELLGVLSLGPIVESEVLDAWTLVRKYMDDKRRAKLKESAVRAACLEAAQMYGLKNHEAVGKRSISYGRPAPAPSPTPASTHSTLPSATLPVDDIPEALLDEVDQLLPDQPWKVGTHNEVASQLRVPAKMVSRAIQLLIAKGRRHVQKDGVVYGPEGQVLASDPER
jgi:hypothetical protein